MFQDFAKGVATATPFLVIRMYFKIADMESTLDDVPYLFDYALA
jgi:hypothetical protein